MALRNHELHARNDDDDVHTIILRTILQVFEEMFGDCQSGFLKAG